MARLANQAAKDPEFKAFAQSFGSIADADKWIRKNFVYRDESEEIVRTPEFMLSDMGRHDGTHTVMLEGDCDDISAFYAAIAKALGLPARLVAIVYTPGSPDFEHVVTQVYAAGNWITYDATTEPGTVIQPIDTMMEYV